MSNIEVKSYSSDNLSFSYNKETKLFKISDELKKIITDSLTEQFEKEVMPYFHKKENSLSININSNRLIFMLVHGEHRVIGKGVIVDAIKGNKESTKILKTNELHQERLMMLGEMSAGISHDINNPLSLIVSANELIKKNFNDYLNTDNEKRKERYMNNIFKKVDTIQEGASRITDIADGIKMFSHKQQIDFKKQNLKNILIKSIAFSRNILDKEQIDLSFNLPDELPDIECKETMLSQVFVNLIKNSHDEIKDFPIFNKWIEINLTQEEDYLKLSFKDGGKGIDPNVVENIFKPFFTTKEIGLGTGLGLSLCKKIIEDVHGGEFFYNPESNNTEFVIKLPIYSENSINQK